jgi:hypothetical protein
MHRHDLPCLPDYQGNSIANLMSSLLTALGGEAPDCPPLRQLPPAKLESYTNLLLLVLDGLGYRFLAERGASCLGSHLVGPITSVFPPTTVAAITTFLTGEAPQRHALTGWHMYFRELGAVLAILPGRPRYGGVGLSRAGVAVTELLETRSVFERIAVTSYQVAPESIARSDFNAALLGPARLRTFSSLSGLFERLTGILRTGRERSYIYAYWPELDAIGHAAGMGSASAQEHFEVLDAAFAAFLHGVRGTNSLIIVTADHGQIDTTAADRVTLDDHPALADSLLLPLCGEPRAAYCYVRCGRREHFERYVRQHLSDVAELWPSEALLERGLFGLGKPSPRLAPRIGDYTLLMKGHHVIKDWLPGERRYTQIGVHGGLSEAELYVPLVLAAV